MVIVIIKGIKWRLALDIVEFVEFLGVNLGVDVVSDYWVLSLKIVIVDFFVIFDLVVEILCYFRFDVGEIELEKCLIV